MTLRIHATWLREMGDMASGPQERVEDRATLGEVEIVAGDVLLTEAADARSARLRRGANLSAYQMAKWLAWHWWRLRWETRRGTAAPDSGLSWSAAHSLGELGDGWLWPSVSFESDGSRVVIRAESSSVTPAAPLRFLGGPVVVVPAGEWERGVDALVKTVLRRLSECGVQADLAVMWEELGRERADPELAAYRTIEARLGFAVDDAPPKAVERIHRAGSSLGHAAMLEVAADGPRDASELRSAAKEWGFRSRVADRPLAIQDVEYGEHKAPWRVGVEAARRLREREGFGGGRISDPRLAGLCAIPTKALAPQHGGPSMAFSLAQQNMDQIVLRSKWRVGRRFEAARLLGDALVLDTTERLRPATSAPTYRQKMQRAFAAEFLCPVESLMDSLEDLSDEAQQQAADWFRVSPQVVASQLVNNGYLERQESRDLDVAA